MKNKIDIFAIISLLSGLATIADVAKNYAKDSKITFSYITIIGIIITILTIIIFILRRNVGFTYKINKILKYYFSHTNDSLEVENKESVYTFKDRTHMEFTKTHKIKSKVAQLSEFCDKFKWSKPQNLDEVSQMLKSIKSNNPNHTITTSRYENWLKYSVGFDGIGKGDTQNISITIPNLEDPKQESLTFLSSSVTFKTKDMYMKVIFEDPNLIPQNVEYKIFKNYASNFPLICKELDVKVLQNSNHRYIECNESMPIPGYRYVITWNF